MDPLRLTLVIVGLIIIGGIYMKFRSSNKTSSNDDDLIPVLTPIEDEPDFKDFEALSQIISGRDQIEEDSKQTTPSFSAVEETGEIGSESLLIILNIMAAKGQTFSGKDIHTEMTSSGLVHAEHQIYHYQKNDAAIFSIANAVEPGFFELTKLDEITTPGLALFMQLPGPVESREALETLLDVSKRLADALGGELCDENRSVLNQQTIAHIKEQVEEYRLKQQSSLRQKHR